MAMEIQEMKIKRIEIRNFRAIRSLELDLRDKINVLVGANGSGKSSILDCIAGLLSRLTARILSPRSPGGSWSEEDISNEMPETDNTISIEFGEIVSTWSVVKTRRGREKTSASKLRGMNAIVNRVQRNFEKNQDASVPLAVYYPVNRAVLEVPLRARDKEIFDQLAAYDGALSGGLAGFKVFFEWFRNREDLENEMFRGRYEESTLDQAGDSAGCKDVQLEAVRRAIQNFLPGFSKPRVKRQPLRMTITKNEEELSVNQLSDGEKCLLAMVGDLARRLALANPEMEDPLSGAGVALIDEVDLHLHPEWQRRVVPMLETTFPNCQFVLTTHSPQVLSEVQPENILVLDEKPVRASDLK